jgi:hypothetical protein
MRGLKLYRAVARAAAVAQVVDRTVPADPALATEGRTTTPAHASQRERAWAMFTIARRLAGGSGPATAYDIERLAARIAREYLEHSIAPARALLEELRARSVDAPGIERLAAPATLPVPRPKSREIEARLEAKRSERKKKKVQARLQAPHKLIGRRYVVGSARVTVIGYDATAARWECVTEDGESVTCSLQELTG